jgi:hypothetical protein
VPFLGSSCPPCEAIVTWARILGLKLLAWNLRFI